MLLLSPSSSSLEQLLALYDPRKVSGLVIWFDPNSLNGSLSDGGSVNTWTDKSTYAHVATTISASKPTFNKYKWNGNSIIRVTAASSQYMTVPRNSCWESSNITIICAFIPASAGSYPKIITRPYRTSGWTSPFASWCFEQGYSTGGRPGFTNTVGSATQKEAYVDTSAASIWNNGRQIVTHVYDGTATAIVRVNGSSRSLTYSTGGASSGNLDYSGGNTDLALFCRSGYSAGEYTDAYIGDILVYNSALSGSDLAFVEKYLSLKYAVDIF